MTLKYQLAWSETSGHVAEGERSSKGQLLPATPTPHIDFFLPAPSPRGAM